MELDRPISIAVILFTILILVFFLVLPQYNKLKALEMDLAQKQAEFNAQYEYFNAINESYHEIQTKRDLIKKIDDALPTNTDFGQLSYYFQKKAKDSGIILKSLILSQASGAKSVKDIVFSMSLMGDYVSLQSFVASLENSARLFEVSNISFGSGGQAVTATPGKTPTQFQGGQTFSFNLEVKAHSY